MIESLNTPINENTSKRYTDVLSENVQVFQNERVELGKATAIIIDGSLGEGKTTLAVNIADELNQMMGFPQIDFDEQLALGGKDFLKKLDQCYKKKYPVVIYDEAGDYSKRGAMSSFNKAINNVFETFRAYRLIVILSLPYFNTLDSNIFKANSVRMLLHCMDRTKNYGNIRAYDIDQMGWLRVHMDLNKHREYVAYSRVLPHFRAHFWNLSEARCKELDKYCTKGKIKILQRANTTAENLIDRNTIKAMFGKTDMQMVVVMKKLHLEPTTIIGRKMYYKRDIVDLLRKTWQ